VNTVNWERLWRMSGITFIVFYIVAFIVYGEQPKVGASADKLVSFYDGDRNRILIAAVFFGFAVLNLLWFAAAITSTLRDRGQGGWGTAATAASAALGSIFFVQMTLAASLAYSIAGSGNVPLTAGLNDVIWVLSVLASFPAAMLIMSGTFGLWRAGIISNGLFYAGVAAVVLVLLGGTTWASSGFWAADGAYVKLIVPIIGLAWLAVISAVLLRLTPSKTPAPEQAAVPMQ